VHTLDIERKLPPFKETQRDSEKKTFEDDCKVKRLPLVAHCPDKLVTISATLQPDEEKELLCFLSKN